MMTEPLAATLASRWGGEPWSPARRFRFRLAFVYFVLYHFPFPLDLVPGLGFLEMPLAAFWRAVVPWAGRGFLGVELAKKGLSSGDSLYGNVQKATFLVVVVAVAVVWTLLDRRRPMAYPRLDAWLRVYVRLTLAYAMFGYGVAKLIPSQFPPPSLDRLVQPIGDASPMGLLWTFMGVSLGYNLFTGFCELAGALLLTHRRTTLLGALLTAAALTNVFLLNLSYDVSVKLYSLHLLVSALWLAAPDFRRLFRALVLNQPVEPALPPPLFTHPRRHAGAVALGTLAVLASLGYSFHWSWRNYNEYGARAPRSPLYGIWEVAEYELDGVIHPPLLTDGERWRRMIFEYPGYVTVQRMDDAHPGYYTLTLAADEHLLRLEKKREPPSQASFTFEQPAADVLLLCGTLDGHPLQLRLARMDLSRFRLRDWRIHWISDHPFDD